MYVIKSKTIKWKSRHILSKTIIFHGKMMLHQTIYHLTSYEWTYRSLSLTLFYMNLKNDIKLSRFKFFYFLYIKKWINYDKLISSNV